MTSHRRFIQYGVRTSWFFGSHFGFLISFHSKRLEVTECGEKVELHFYIVYNGQFLKNCLVTTKNLQNADFFLKRERQAIKNRQLTSGLYNCTLLPLLTSLRWVGARKIDFFSSLHYNFVPFSSFGVNLSRKVNCFLCAINTVQWKKTNSKSNVIQDGKD